MPEARARDARSYARLTFLSALRSQTSRLTTLPGRHGRFTAGLADTSRTIGQFINRSGAPENHENPRRDPPAGPQPDQGKLSARKKRAFPGPFKTPSRIASSRVSIGVLGRLGSGRGYNSHRRRVGGPWPGGLRQSKIDREVVMDWRMVRRSACRAACWVVAAWVGVGVGLGAWDGAAAVALTPSRLVVFGDSLSDIGNIEDATLGIGAGIALLQRSLFQRPGMGRVAGHDLGLAPLKSSTAGGDNFAYGGAQTSGASGFGGLFIRDLDEQLADYRASRTIDPNALYVVWAGANDLFDGQTNVNVPIGRVVATLELLTTLGARQFVVPNLPILGKIPEYNRDPTASAAFDKLSHDYNAAFAGAVDQLAARHLNATFYQLDVAELFSNAIAKPAAWGLTNVTDPAAPGLNPGALFYNENRIVAHPEQYLFWDTIHPTTAVHRILGDAASRLIEGVLGDFDTDGVVDAADLSLLRSGVGAAKAVRRQGDADGDGDVDGGDFLAWQRSLGTNLAASPRAVAAAAGVPEPGSAGLLAVGASVLLGSRRVRRTWLSAATASSKGDGGRKRQRPGRGLGYGGGGRRERRR